MIPERADELLAGLFDGSLTEMEHRELLEAALADPALGRRLTELLKLQPYLVDALAGDDGEEGFLSRVLHAQGNQSDTAFIRAVVREAADAPPMGPQGKPATRRLRTRRMPPRRNEDRGSWTLLLTAASVFLALGLAVFFSSSPSGNSGNRAVRREPAKESDVRPTVRAVEERARASAERKRLEEEFTRMDEARLKAEMVELQARNERRDEDRRRAEADLLRITEERKAAAERLARAREDEEKAEKAASTLPSPSVPRETRSVVALLERLEGDIRIFADGAFTAAQAGQELLEGQGIETFGQASKVVLRFTDKTKVELGGDTRTRKFVLAGGKHLLIEAGTLIADVAKQPKDQPLVFATPHGEATVLGTTLRIVVDADPKKGMRLEVEEGKVRLRNLAGKTVLVESGHYAVAAAGAELTSKPFPPPALARLESAGEITFSFGFENRTLPDGVFGDAGEAFLAKRGFGWKGPNLMANVPGATDPVLLRRPHLHQATVLSDPLRSSHITAGGPDRAESWSVKVPNGRYLVTVCVGRSNYAMPHGPHHVRIEGLPVIEPTILQGKEFVEKQDIPIEVKDGDLTMIVGGHGRTDLVTPPGHRGDTAVNYLILKKARP